MRLHGFILFLCAVAACLPALPLRQRDSQRVASFPGWGASPVGRPGEPIALGERERRFQESFPGRVAAFARGDALWVLRWIDQPTRKLHPAADCLKGAGFTVTPGPAWKEADGSLWGASEASRAGERYRVHERIVDAEGRIWTDVSAWYWSALLGRSTGPWWAVTRLEPRR